MVAGSLIAAGNATCVSSGAPILSSKPNRDGDTPLVDLCDLLGNTCPSLEKSFSAAFDVPSSTSLFCAYTSFSTSKFVGFRV